MVTQQQNYMINELILIFVSSTVLIYLAIYLYHSTFLTYLKAIDHHHLFMRFMFIKFFVMQDHVVRTNTFLYEASYQEDKTSC